MEAQTRGAVATRPGRPRNKVTTDKGGSCSSRPTTTPRPNCAAPMERHRTYNFDHKVLPRTHSLVCKNGRLVRNVRMSSRSYIFLTVRVGPCELFLCRHSWMARQWNGQATVRTSLLRCHSHQYNITTSEPDLLNSVYNKRFILSPSTSNKRQFKASRANGCQQILLSCIVRVHCISLGRALRSSGVDGRRARAVAAWSTDAAKTAALR